MLVTAAVAAVTSMPGHAAAAPSTDQSGCRTVHVGPAQVAGQPPSSYFRISPTPGTPTRAAVVVANPQDYDCHVLLVGATARTATNSGETYPPVSAAYSCTGASCWLTGLPTTVTVPAHGRLDVPFTVDVPTGTAAGQYLAGVVAQPADPAQAPSSTPTGAGQGTISARVVARVSLGVAITVPGALTPSVTIPGVRLLGTNVQGQPTVAVTEHNAGNTWERPSGTLTIAGRTLTLSSATVLPGDSATLSLAVAGVRGGAHPVAVVLHYAKGARTVSWSGTLRFPTAATIEHRNGETVVVTPAATAAPVRASATTPAWLVATLAAVSVVLVLVLTVVAVFLLRRRRSRRPVARHAAGRHRSTAQRPLVGAATPSP